jgi:hypothetical protein
MMRLYETKTKFQNVRAKSRRYRDKAADKVKTTVDVMIPFFKSQQAVFAPKNEKDVTVSILYL